MSHLTKTLESATRKRLDLMLLNLGWNADEHSNNCNVYTERAKTVAQNKAFKGKKPDYVLYKAGTDTPIGIIETKRSGQSLAKALSEAVAKYATPLGVNTVFVTDGSLIETYDTRSKSPLMLDDQIVTEFLTERQLVKYAEHGAALRSPERVNYTKRELITIFADANNLLRKEGIREGIERFSEFSNLLFLQLISEIEDDRENNGEERILEPTYCWESFCNLKPDMMLRYINNTILPKLGEEYNHSSDVFQRALLLKSPESLQKIVSKLSALKLLDADSDIKGDAFEYFLKNSVSVGTDLGEYFTPRHIVKLMVDLVDPKFGDKVYDPACGTGGFLIEAFKHIKNKCKQTRANIDILKNDTIYGREISGTAKIAKMNMIIIGDGHNNVVQTDSLKNPVKGEYNIILTNFPFSQTTDYGSYYGFPSDDANPIFIKHVIDALVDGGTAAVVVPEGLLFDEKPDYVRMRKMLLTSCEVTAVIKLHAFVFKPYTGQPTSIVIFKKGKPTKKVWFFDVREDGFKKSGSKLGRPPIQQNDLIKLRQLWRDKEDSEQSFSVEAKAFGEQKYKLSLDNYRRSQNAPQQGTLPLGELCDIVIGGTPSRRNFNYFTGDKPWAKIKDLRDMYINDTEENITAEAAANSSVKLLPKGTLLFSFKLSVGRVSIAGRELYTNEAIAGLIPKDDRVSVKYLYYVLPRLDYSTYTQRATKGMTLNKEILTIVDVPVPPPEAQKAMIAEMDRREEQKRKYALLLRKMAEEQNKVVADLVSVRPAMIGHNSDAL